MYLIELLPDSKQPPAGRWNISNDPAVHAKWLKERKDMGLMMTENKRVVLDFDGPGHKGGKELAREFFKKYRELLSVIVETPSGGIHFHFSGETQTRKILDAEGREIGDVKGSGYVKWIGTVRGKAYRVLQYGPLQAFPEHLFPAKPASGPAVPGKTSMQSGKINNIRAYISKIPSISGQHGHDAAFRVACVLRDAGFSEVDALAEMTDWNVTCAQPPWSVRELAKKVKDAFRVVLKGT
jgi:hypothetical protein